MRKRAAMLFLVCMLAVSGTFVGCSNKNAEKAQEYKELGIKQLNDASYEDAAESFQKGGSISEQFFELFSCLQKYFCFAILPKFCDNHSLYALFVY